ncbi:uroporphyrinogen-III synthase [Jeotgalibacillus aurantiacus]|uniref:uroporphyrinogen-III synthase n=1 Tax=Jeotgalibacillus aurantiacus TaxID=2763266 RepID=UPI001D09AB9F|nr:uroporphyrinogen-III synthase [Jeotgalibacillus aurantiacus]
MTGSLLNRTILLTRPLDQAKRDQVMIEELGGTALILPMIETRALHDSDGQSFIHQLGTFDWVILTSRNAAKYFLDRLTEADTVSELRLCKVGAVGQKTAAFLYDHGIEADFVPSSFKGADFIKEFPADEVKGLNMLYPQGNIARGEIAAAFEKEGATCKVWTLYETFKPDIDTEKLSSITQVDVVTFASPSAVRHFVESAEKAGAPILTRMKEGRCKIASIGPTTSAELFKRGLPVHMEPADYTIKAMIEKIAACME